MECRAVGKEPIEYLWLKDENGKKTKIQNKPGIYVDEKSGLLLFESLVAENWGDYICQAQNHFHFVPSDTVKVTFEPFREKGTTKRTLKIQDYCIPILVFGVNLGLSY